MKFYDGEEELDELKTLRKKLPSMIVITGRRRVGKTELIKEFSSYFQCRDAITKFKIL